MSTQEAFERFARDGGGDVFEAALPELDRQIRKYLLFFGARGELLEELAQEAVVRVYSKEKRVRGIGVAQLHAYLRTTCRNLVVDEHRRAQKSGLLRKTDENQANPSNPGDQGAGAASASLADPVNVPDRESDDGLSSVLESCIDRLGEPGRTVFELRYRADLSTTEIAELFGRTPRWCYTVLKRVQTSLADGLRNCGYDIKT